MAGRKKKKVKSKNKIPDMYRILPNNILKKNLSELKKDACPSGYSKMNKNELQKMSKKYHLEIYK